MIYLLLNDGCVIWHAIQKTEAYFLSNLVVFRWSENGLLKEKDRLNFGLAENYYGKHPVKKDYSCLCRLKSRKAIQLNRFPELFVSLPIKVKTSPKTQQAPVDDRMHTFLPALHAEWFLSSSLAFCENQ
jgi:hypothetical protein